jgi:hypothetical protein
LFNTANDVWSNWDAYLQIKLRTWVIYLCQPKERETLLVYIKRELDVYPMIENQIIDDEGLTFKIIFKRDDKVVRKMENKINTTCDKMKLKF